SEETAYPLADAPYHVAKLVVESVGDARPQVGLEGTLGGELARGGVVARPRPRSRPDHVEVRDRDLVARIPYEGTKEELLREVMTAAHAVTADEIRVLGFEVRRREHPLLADQVRNSGRIPFEFVDYAVGDRFFCVLPVGGV